MAKTNKKRFPGTLTETDHAFNLLDIGGGQLPTEKESTAYFISKNIISGKEQAFLLQVAEQMLTNP